MRNPIVCAGIALSAIAIAIFMSACVTNHISSKRDVARLAAWEKFSKGDFFRAEQESELLLREAETENAGHYMLALVNHVTGKYQEAIRHYDLIKPGYRQKKQLTEAISWSYIHLGDIDGAFNCLDEARRFNYRDKAFQTVLECMRKSPMRVEIPDLVELPFAADPLSPYMPGIEMKINGKQTVARLDTGGSFVHVSSVLAEELGIKTVAKIKTFASLTSLTVKYGFVDIELGSAKIKNIPVAVHEKGLDLDLSAASFGVKLGPIIGTNVLEQFLATIDGPGKRLILSARHNPAMQARHEVLLRGKPTSVPFALWQDHFMIAHGSVGDRNNVGMFFDSGLLVIDGEQNQASMLTPVSVLASWNVAIPDAANGVLAKLPNIRIGDAGQNNATAYPVSDTIWKNFGDWGGIQVDTLLSWGFLKERTWTIDFDERVFIFRDSSG